MSASVDDADWVVCASEGSVSEGLCRNVDGQVVWLVLQSALRW